MAIEIDQNTIIRLLVRRGSEAEKNSIILAQGEPGYAIDSKVLVVGDGITYGGVKIPNVDNTTIEWANTTPNYIQLKDGGISNIKLAPALANTLKGNNTSGTTTPIDIPINANSMVGRIDNVNSGNLASISFPTLFGNLFSPTAPDPTFLGFWFNTTNNKLYFYNGVNWLSNHQYAPNDPIRILYVGNGSSVATYDGGDTNAASVSGGPMWEIDTDYTSKVLRGAAAGSSATTPYTGGGADTQNILPGMVPDHYHGYGDFYSAGSNIDDDYMLTKRNWSSGTSFNTSAVISKFYGGEGVRSSGVLGTTGPILVTGSTTTPLPTLPAYQEVLVLKRTSRVYYVV